MGANSAAVMARWREWDRNGRLGREPPGRDAVKGLIRKALMELAELDGDD
jgi:hypothetical protein